MSNLSGSCLCGNIKFQCDAEPAFAANCHCDDCRQATGACYATISFVAREDVQVSGMPKTFDHPAASGNVLSKHFCGDCGSTLFTSNAAHEGMIGIMAGVLEDRDAVKPQLNVYVSRKVPTTPLDDALPAHQKMPG